MWTNRIFIPKKCHYQGNWGEGVAFGSQIKIRIQITSVGPAWELCDIVEPPMDDHSIGSYIPFTGELFDKCPLHLPSPMHGQSTLGNWWRLKKFLLMIRGRTTESVFRGKWHFAALCCIVQLLVSSLVSVSVSVLCVNVQIRISSYKRNDEILKVKTKVVEHN